MEGFFYSSVEDVKSNYWKSFVNKGFLFNENYFTTMLIHQGRVVFEPHHKHRLLKTLEFMDVAFGEKLVEDIFSICHTSLLKTMGADKNLYVRVNLYKSLDGKIQYFIWSENKDPIHTELNLRTELFHPNKNYPSYIKKADYDIQFKLRKKVQKLGADDVLFVDDQQRVLDLATSNIVFTKDGSFIHSPIIPGVFDGICLRNFLDFLGEQNLKIHSREIKSSEIKDFDGAIALNSFSMTRPISKVDDWEYNLDSTEDIIEKFNEHVGIQWIERI